MILYHATTPKKARLYRHSGRIISPVRGFTTPAGAMAWAMKTGRTVIMEIVCPNPYKLPDHHNPFGEAWWNDGDVVKWKCLYSANREGPSTGSSSSLENCESDKGFGGFNSHTSHSLVGISTPGVGGMKPHRLSDLLSDLYKRINPTYGPGRQKGEFLEAPEAVGIRRAALALPARSGKRRG